jgi:polyhydroxyalkanoate synthesis regulator phasin
MVREALTGYWSLVSGLTEVTVERARAAAKALVAQGDATREQVGGLAQEIAETSRANREALIKLVRYETERAAGRLGFAGSDEVSRLQGRVRDLERSIADLRAASEPAAPAKATPAEAPPKAAKAPANAGNAPAKAAKATKATKAGSAKKATPRKRTAAATGADGPGSAS